MDNLNQISTMDVGSSSTINSSSSLSFPLPNWIHHVFPSFHGPDVRKTFLSHILESFKRKGIDPFIDNDIERSKSIGPELKEAIRGSRIAIVLLSKNYASSSWCLDELVEIMRCRKVLGQIVIPIFYDVQLTNIRKQTGAFGEAFKKTCKDKLKEHTKRWREALDDVAEIAGMDSDVWDNEAVMIEKLTDNVLDKLRNFAPPRDFKDLVGMSTHMEEIKRLFIPNVNEGRMIGIWGPPGIGKTTIARFLFHQLSSRFQLRSIMVNIKANYSQSHLDDSGALEKLQHQMLLKISNQKDNQKEVPNLELALNGLKDKKVLLVLDDVDRIEQVHALAKEIGWFGPGSCVIITTENRRILEAHGIKHINKVKSPSSKEAFKIFCMNAFGKEYPDDGFYDLACEATNLSGELPLGLKVLGSALWGMSKQEWRRALPMLKARLVDREIESIIKFSYDALHDQEKKLFLYIACLFLGSYTTTHEVEELLAKKFWNVKQSVDILVKKSFIYIEGGVFKVHTLLEQFGREISRKQVERQLLIDAKDLCDHRIPITTMVTGKRCRPQDLVFINFWGDEVRCSFVSHLVYAFSREGVNISVRKYEKRGEDLGNTLQIIEDSKIALVIFSSRYTESRWCLEELVKIEECKHEGGLSVIPIFYKVEPSQVKQLEGDFGLNFWNLWRIHRDHCFIKWKDALESVASIDGLCLKDHSSESKFIDSIVKKVLGNIHLPEGENSSLPSERRKKTPKFYREKGEKHESFLDKCPLFGLEHRMKLLEQKLEFDCNETRIIGVVGMTGIGKTTLAMMLHEKWNCNFVRCVALLDIHKKSEKWLRKTLLEMLRGRKLPGTSDDVTHESMKSKLLENKVFIVLDDVSNKEQLDFLLGDRNWIKNGSKVVITVREKSLVEDIVHDTYVVPPLNYGEALQLFSYHAFGDHVFDPTVTSTKVFTEFLDCAGGNPLVIKLLGKKLHGRDEAQWEMSEGDMEELSMMSLDIFKLSFDELSEKEKNVFLDIACFFRSENEYLVRNLLDPGDHNVTDAESVVRDLTHKCMIVISDFRVEMHGLLHVFGRKYSSQTFIVENGGESRLWYTPEIIDALVNQKDAESMRGIFLDIAEVTKGMVLHRRTFIHMINLRYLKIYDSFCPRSCKALSKLQFPCELEFRMEKVRYLHWVKFPLEELPSDFRAENLVDLRLPYSMVERVWQGVKDTPQLKWVDLSHSRKLLTLSELAKAESLQKLNLEGCTMLQELPGEMQNMKSLVYLNLRGCKRLSSLPKMNLTSLKTLVLSNCLNLKEFQVIAKNLEVLHLDGTAIKGLHPSIENLQRLVVLNMRNCKMLESLPNCLGQLKALEELILSGCSRLQNLPDVRQSMKHVQILLLDGIGAKEMPKISCFTGADDQTSVDMVLQPSGSYPSDWPRGLDGVYSLRRLCLSGNEFVRLQNDIGKLYNLRWLDVKHCKKLRSVPMLPPRLQYFDAHGCDSLEKVGNPLANLLLTEQVHAIFNFSNCNKLDQDAQDSIISYTRRRSQLMLGTLSRYNRGFTLEPLARSCFPGREIPEWFSHRGSGSVLEPKLPPHWCDKRLTGIALCAVILCAGDHEQRGRLLVNCNCKFENADGFSIYFSCTVGDWNELSNTPQKMELCHVFIGYTSRLDISKAVGYDEERCFCTKSSFEFQVTDGTENVVGCEVLQCGFSLVYATDDRENICLDAKTLVVPKTVKETSSNDDIQCQYEILHTDQLTEQQKNVLLDIACFFRSEDEYFVRSLLDSGDPDSMDALSEVRNLAEKFLIRICDGRVEMNDRQYTFCKDFGSPGRLRLCKYEDILRELRNTQKLEANTVRGIFLDMSEVLGSFPLERTTFISMRDLRYLKVYESCCPRKGKSDWKIKFPDGLDFPLEEVRYFHWQKFPLEELPPDFKLENLVDLRLPYSNISLLWKGVKDTRRLKWVDLSYSAQLLNLSGLAKAENLKRLNLEGCTNLNELPGEMQNMKSLVHLNMRGCIRLRSLPEMNLVSLKTLILSDCSNLEEFQVISKSLESLYLDGTAIKELPLDIQKVQRLVVLNLKNCRMLERLPPCLGKLKVLEEIILTGCLRLKNLSDVMHSMKHVQILLFDGAGLDEMPNLSSFTGFNGQSSVDISIQNLGSDSSPPEWPLGVNRVSSLRRLCLSGNDFVSLQNNIGQLYNLIWLDVKQCKKLTSVPMLPPKLEYFDAHGCDSLERVANPLALQVLTEQIHATYNFSNCNKLHQEATNAIISYTRWKSQLILDAQSRYDGGFALQALVGTCFPGWEVPTWFSYRASGSLLEPKLPPHWCNNRFTGIALCAVILFPAYRSHQNSLLVTCNCKFKNEDGFCSLFSFPVGGWSEPGEAIKSSHVFIGYASEMNVKKLREENEGCIHTEASFEFQVKNDTKEYEGCKVLKCGFSLVYEYDDLQVNSGEHVNTEPISTKSGHNIF